VSNFVDPSWVRLSWFSTTILSPTHKNGNEPQVPQTHCSHRTQVYGGEGTTWGPRLFITNIEKPVLAVYQKRGENQPEVSSRFSLWRLQGMKNFNTFSGHYKSIGSGCQVKVRGEKKGFQGMWHCRTHNGCLCFLLLLKNKKPLFLWLLHLFW
jgi:hypothetical protein